MDTELKALMSRFSAVQRDDGSGSKRLNERNVVEIIAMLQRRGALELVYTADGREYLTWPQLRREIRDEVAVRGGRLDVCELPSALGVDMLSIERAVAEIVAEERDHGDFTLHEGEVITQTFFQSVAERVNTALRDVGHVSISGLARDINLSFAFTANLLKDFAKQGKLTHCVVDDESVYTELFVANQQRRLVAALLGCLSPVRITDVAKRRGLYEPLVPVCVQRLTAARMLPGRVEGGSYVPASFEAARNAGVVNFYSSNGFIPYAAAAAQGVANPRVFLCELFNGSAVVTSCSAAAPIAGGASSSKRGAGRGRGGGRGGKSGTEATAADVSATHGATMGHALSAAFVSDKLLRGIEPHLDELLSSESLTVDLADFFPACVAAVDRPILVDRLLQLFPSVADACDVVAGSTVVRRNAWDAVVSAVAVVAKEELARDRKAVAFTAADDPRTANRKLVLLISRKLKWPDDAVVDGSPLFALLELWAPRIEEVFATARAEMARRGDANAKQLTDYCVQEGKRHWSALQFASRALESMMMHAADLGGDATLTLVAKHIVSTHAVTIAKLAFVERTAEVPALRNKLAPAASPVAAGAAAAAGGASKVFPFANLTLQQMLALVPKEEQAVFKEIVDCVQGNAALGAVAHVASVCKALEEASARNAIRFPLHSLNKKAERQELKLAKEALRSQSLTPPSGDATDEDGARAQLAAHFEALCSYGLALAIGAVTPLPGKALGPIVSFVVAKCGGAVAESLVESHKAIVEMIVSKGSTSAAAQALGGLRKALAQQDTAGD